MNGDTRPDPRIVTRDQCNGRDLACVNCVQPLGEPHVVICYAYAIRHQETSRG